MRGEKSLAVFVHGIGAKASDFWGSTPASLRSDSRLGHLEFDFWGYPTSKKPFSWLISLIKGKQLQKLEQLGEHLLSHLGHLYKPNSHGSIVLFGHSMGGLVIAAAVGFALRYGQDKRLIEALRVIGLCATPLGGSDLATKAHRIFQIFAENVQLKDLAKDSPERKIIVNEFINRAVDPESEGENHRRIPLQLFRAADDPVVQEGELYGPLKDIVNKLPRLEVLNGGHSECIQDLGPGNENYEAIVGWLAKISPQAESDRSPEESGRYFKILLEEIRGQLGAGGMFKAWREPESEQQHGSLSREYLSRIGLQKLLHAATAMHSNAAGSANLWVCHHQLDKQSRPEWLRSEEREGYFAIGQLVQTYLGTILYRPFQIFYDAAAIEKNSVAARAVAQKKVVFMPTETTEYNSNAEVAGGITHILGIPSRNHDDQPAVREREPLSMTIDFKFPNPPSKKDEEAILNTGREIADIFRQLCDFWRGEKTR